MAQAHATIPDDAWEYHIRKSLNDAAYKGLDYVPYCTTMPLKPQSDNVKFLWVRAPLSCAYACCSCDQQLIQTLMQKIIHTECAQKKKGAH